MIEGALIAAIAVGADRVVFGLKRSFGEVVTRVRAAIAEMDEAGWTGDIEVIAFEGPDEYLYGEETALLESIDGRYPFPRLAPPYRRGVDEVVETEADTRSGSGQSSHVEMAGAFNETGAPPALVDNVETLANVPGIIARGGSWFRTEGTDQSPGTIVCTVSGAVNHAGVAEFLMGTPLREVIETIGGGIQGGRPIVGILNGVSNSLLTPDDLDAPVSYEGLAAAGSGLGSAGFVVYDDRDDLVAAVAGVSRFLAIESCGQCTPCKLGGLALAGLLDKLSRSAADERDLAAIHERVETVADGARCFLASQQEVVVRSLLDRFDDAVQGHLHRPDPGGRAHVGVRTGDHRRRHRHPRRAAPHQAARLELRRLRLGPGAGRPLRRAPGPDRAARLTAPTATTRRGSGADQLSRNRHVSEIGLKQRHRSDDVVGMTFFCGGSIGPFPKARRATALARAGNSPCRWLLRRGVGHCDPTTRFATLTGA